MIPAVIYAAKSTKDPKGSIPTQIADCRAMCLEQGWKVEGEPHQDEARSAYSGNRGRGLQAAKDAAVAAAAEYGEAMLVVQHSDRLARGDGDGPDAADHLAEVFFWARRHNVRLRSVQDDHNLEDPLRAVLGGERNHEDSARKAQAVADGKQRQRERGEHLGGPVRDGFRLLVQRDDRDQVIGRTYELDPGREPTIRRMFELAEESKGDPTIARQLNAEGHRTRVLVVKSGPRKGELRGGKPWTRREVQEKLTDAFYAGGIVYYRGKPNQQIVWDNPHPGYVTRKRWEALQAARASRDVAKKGRPTGGRPTRRFALSRLATCGKPRQDGTICGSGMAAVTSPYVRKDGTRKLSYHCIAAKEATGTCDAPPIDAREVDGAVVELLPSLLVDFDRWAASMDDNRQAELRGAEGALSRALAALDDQDAMLGKIEADYERQVEAGDEDAAAFAARMVGKHQRRRQSVEAEVGEHRALVEALGNQHAPTDAALDFFNELRGAVATRLKDSSGDLRVLNERLREVFAAFVLTPFEPGEALQLHGVGEAATPYEGAGVGITPVLASDAAQTLWERATQGDNGCLVLPPAPPSLAPLVTGRHSHE